MLQAAGADIRSATAGAEPPPEPTYAQRQFALGRLPYAEMLGRPQDVVISGLLGRGREGMAAALRGETRPEETDFYALQTQAEKEGLVPRSFTLGGDIAKAATTTMGQLLTDPLLYVTAGVKGVAVAGKVLPGTKAVVGPAAAGLKAGFTAAGQAIAKASPRAGKLGRLLVEDINVRELKGIARRGFARARDPLEAALFNVPRVERTLNMEAKRIANETGESLDTVLTRLRSGVGMRIEEAQKTPALQETYGAAYNVERAQTREGVLAQQQDLLRRAQAAPDQTSTVLADAAKADRDRVKQAVFTARNRMPERADGTRAQPDKGAVAAVLEEMGGRVNTPEFRQAIAKLKETPQLKRDVGRVQIVKEGFQPFAEVKSAVQAGGGTDLVSGLPHERTVMNPGLMASAKETLNTRIVSLEQGVRTATGGIRGRAQLKLNQARASLTNVERVEAGISEPSQYLAAVADVQKGLQRAKGALQTRLRTRVKASDKFLDNVAAEIGTMRTIAQEETAKIGAGVQRLVPLTEEPGRLSTGSTKLNAVADEIQRVYDVSYRAEADLGTPYVSQISVQKRPEFGGGRAVVGTQKTSTRQLVENVANDIAARAPQAFNGLPLSDLIDLKYAPRLMSDEAKTFLKKYNLPDFVAGLAAKETRVRSQFQKARDAWQGMSIPEINVVMRDASHELNPYGRAFAEFFRESPSYQLAERLGASTELLGRDNFVQGVVKTFGVDSKRVPPGTEGFRALDPDKLKGADRRLFAQLYKTDVADALEDTYGKIFHPQMGEFAKAIMDYTTWWKGWTLNVFPQYHVRNAAGNMLNNYLAGLDPIMGMKFYRWASRLQDDLTPLGHDLRIKFGEASPWYDAWTNRLFPKSKWTTGQDVVLDGVNLGKHEDLVGNIQEILASGFRRAEEASALRAEERSILTGSRALVSKTIGSQNPAQEAGRALGQTLEDNARVAHYLWRRVGGMSHEDAVASVNKYLFDYLDVGTAENAMRRYGVTPFLVWTRKNLWLQMKSVLESPGRQNIGNQVFKMYMAGKPINSPPEAFVPDWVQENLGVPVRHAPLRRDPVTGKMTGGETEYLLLGSWAPQTQLVDPAVSLGEFVKGVLGPNVKLPIELGSGWLSDDGRYLNLTTGAQELGELERPMSTPWGPVGLGFTARRLLQNIRLLNEVEKFYRSGEYDPVRDVGKQSISDRALGILVGRTQRFNDAKLRRDALRQAQGARREILRSLIPGENRRKNALPADDSRRATYDENIQRLRDRNDTEIQREFDDIRQAAP